MARQDKDPFIAHLACGPPDASHRRCLGVLNLLVTPLILSGLLGAGFAGAFAPSPLPEPSPQWPLVIAYPTLLTAVLLFIAGWRLQYRLALIEGMREIKAGDIVSRQDVNVSLMFQSFRRGIVANVSFERCTLKGPCTVGLLGSVELDGCTFAGGETLEQHLIEASPERKYAGIGAFLHCKFQYCTFDNILFLVEKPVADKMRATIVQP